MGNNRYLPVGTILIMLAIGCIAQYWGVVSLTIKDISTEQIFSLLLSLIFIAIIIERAVEVFISNTFDSQELEASRNVRLMTQRLETLQETLKAETSHVIPISLSGVQPDAVATDHATAVQALRENIKSLDQELVALRAVANKELETIRIRKINTASTLALIMGFGVALTGAGHVISNITSLTNDVTPFQNFIIGVADIMLTGLLLAGGADGIHKVFKTLNIFQKDMKPRV